MKALDGMESLSRSSRMMRLSPWLSAPPTTNATKRPTPWWAMLISAGLGGGLSFVVITMALEAPLMRELLAMPAEQALVFAAGALVMVWLALLVHECGHLLGGALGGLRPFLLLAGPLRLDFSAEATRLSLNRAGSTWGGLAVALPPDEALQKRSVACMVAGGPLASVLLALLAWVAAGLVPWQAASQGSMFHLMAQAWLYFLCLISATIALGTLLPMSMGGYVSDGGQLLQLLRGSPDSAHRLQLAAVIGKSTAGIRPRDWPLRVLEEVGASARAPQLRTSALLMRAQSEDDRHPLAIEDPQHPALQAFEALALDLHHGGLAHYPTAFRAELMLPVATFLAQRLGDSHAGAAWLKASDGGLAQELDRLHARAAVAWAEGDRSSAAGLAEQALRAGGLWASGDRGGPPLDGVKVMAQERLLALMNLRPRVD